MSHRLLINDIQLPDPFTLDMINDFKQCPPFGLFDIFNHLIYHFTSYDKQGLAAFKSYEDYSLFYDGYVESLLTNYYKEAQVHAFVGKVKPAMKEKTKDNKEFYDLWFILEGRGASRGSFIDAYCVCLGRRHGGCKHIAAAMHSLEDLLNSRGEDTVTSGPSQWNRKPKPDTTSCAVKDHLIVRKKKRCLKDQEQDASLGRKRLRSYTFSQFIDHDPHMPSDRLPCSPAQLSSIVDSMEQMKSKPVIMSVLANQLYCCEDMPDNNTKQQDVILILNVEYQNRNLLSMSTNKHSNTKSSSKSLQFTDEERSKVDAKNNGSVNNGLFTKLDLLQPQRLKVFTRDKFL